MPFPVVSVGNLTFGGTGKTPFVVHVCRALIARGKRPAILSRGYGNNDEGRVLARWLPDVPQGINPDRFAGGQALSGQADCFVLDDGFQHMPLARELDVVLIDATRPFGGGHCPPGGRLREPLQALERAGLVVITRADLVSRDELGAVMRKVREYAIAPVATGRFRPTVPTSLVGLDVTVACGIGNPRAFVATVEQLGARVIDTRFFRDHHAFDARDARQLAARAGPVVVTEKDAVKLEPIWPKDGAPLHVVRIEFEAMDGAADIAAAWDTFCA